MLRADLAAIRIGARSNVQDNTVVHADSGRPCLVGERVTVGHAAVLHGCTIEDDCPIGIGAIVLNGARIGRGTVIATGALVPEDELIPPSSLVVGVLGCVRALARDDLPARMEASWRAYVRLAEEARTGADRPLPR